MNPRIKELMEQCVFSDRVPYPTQEEVFEKFAHLVARETFDWIVENVGLMEDQEWQALSKHLGLVVEQR